MKMTWLPIFVAIMSWPMLAAGDGPATEPTMYRSMRKIQILSGPQFGDDIDSARQDFWMQFSNQISQMDGDWSADPPTITFSSSTRSAIIGDKLLDTAIGSLKQLILDHVELSRVKWKHELNDLDQKLQELEERRMVLEKKALQERGDLADIQKEAGLSDDDAESPHELIHTLETQYEAAQIDLVGKMARQQALADAISKLSSQAAANVDADPITKQLQEVVDVKQKQLERENNLVRTGAIPMSQPDQTAAELAQAKAAVLERKEAAAKAAGADSLQQWNHELMMLSVDISELKARTEMMKKRLDQLSQAVPVLERAISGKAISKSLDEIDSEIVDVTVRSGQLRQSLKPGDEPKVVVLESKDEPVDSGSGVEK